MSLKNLANNNKCAFKALVTTWTKCSLEMTRNIDVPRLVHLHHAWFQIQCFCNIYNNTSTHNSCSTARNRHRSSLPATVAHSIVPCQMRVSIVASAFLLWVTQWLNRHSALTFSSAAPPSHVHPPLVVFHCDGPPTSWESNSTVRRKGRGVGILLIEVFITAGPLYIFRFLYEHFDFIL